MVFGKKKKESSKVIANVAKKKVKKVEEVKPVEKIEPVAKLPLPPPPPLPKGVVDPLVKKNMGLKYTLAGIIFLSVVIVGFLLYLKTDIQITKSTTIAALSFSILFNLVVIIVLFGSGMGQEIVGRLKRRILFGTGKYVNTLYVSKNGPIKELFKKVDDEVGDFKINGRTSVRNPSLLHLFKKLPTYIHREGSPDPVNIFEKKFAGEMSESEVDAVMMNKGAFDFKQWVKQNAMILVIVGVVIVGAAAFAGYTGMMNMQMLRDGTYAAVECIVPVVEIVAGGVV